MAQPKTRTSRRDAVLPEYVRAPMRAWHVIMNNGADQTITAHECDIFGGVLAFSTAFARADDFVVVRAFAPGAWQDVDLVDTELVAVHVAPPPHLVTCDD